MRKIFQEVLGRTNSLPSFGITKTARRTKNLGEHTETYREQGDIISLLTKIRGIHRGIQRPGDIISFLTKIRGAHRDIQRGS
jgi:hypothetical protein